MFQGDQGDWTNWLRPPNITKQQFQRQISFHRHRFISVEKKRLHTWFFKTVKKINSGKLHDEGEGVKSLAMDWKDLFWTLASNHWNSKLLFTVACQFLSRSIDFWTKFRYRQINETASW